MEQALSGRGRVCVIREVGGELRETEADVLAETLPEAVGTEAPQQAQ